MSAIGIEELTRAAGALELASGKIVVDLGCGSGGIGLWLALRTGATLVGVDFSAIAIANAKRLAEDLGLSERARFVVEDFTKTRLPDESADAVISVDALMFCDAACAVREIARLLKPGGRAAVVAAEAITEDAPAILPRDYRDVLEDAGLRVLEHAVLDKYRERLPRLYRALNARQHELREQGGIGAESLLAESQKWLEREHLPPRAREILITATLG